MYFMIHSSKCIEHIKKNSNKSDNNIFKCSQVIVVALLAYGLKW